MDRKTNRNNVLGLKHINFYKGYYYVKIFRNGKYAFNTRRKCLETAIKVRDEFLMSEQNGSLFQKNLKKNEENISIENIKKNV